MQEKCQKYIDNIYFEKPLKDQDLSGLTEVDIKVFEVLFREPHTVSSEKQKKEVIENILKLNAESSKDTESDFEKYRERFSLNYFKKLKNDVAKVVDHNVKQEQARLKIEKNDNKKRMQNMQRYIDNHGKTPVSSF